MSHKHNSQSAIRQSARTTPVSSHWATGLLVVVVLLGGVLSGCGEAAVAPTSTIPAPPATPTLPPPVTPTTAPVAPPYWPIDGWRTSTPEEQGVDSAQLLRILQYINETGINLRTLTIIRHGYIVLETSWQPYTMDMPYEVKSVTKSVMSALFGIAIHEGYIKDVKQKVLSYFPEKTITNRDKDKEALTIEDLLSMQAGLDCADDKLNGAMEQSKDWVQFALDLPMASPPGQKLVYCTAGPHILSAILTKATGMSTSAYAQSRLFGPLGIASGDITWQKDPQGIYIGGYGIAMKPHDMARIGLLYMHGGKWAGKQVVPEDWVTASTSVHALGESHKDYGYLFWLYPSHFAAEGLGEQKIMVSKSQDMIVVTTAAIDWHKGPVLEKLFDNYILPAAASDVPLPANPTALESLKAETAFLANPMKPVPPLSEVARQISGLTYVLEDNPFGWKTLNLRFEEGNSLLLATLEALNGTTLVTQTATIGMDNVFRVERAQDGSFAARKGYWATDHTLVVRQLQSSPDVTETEMRADFSGDIVKIHVEEIVFNSQTADFQGTTSSPVPTAPTSTGEAPF